MDNKPRLSVQIIELHINNIIFIISTSTCYINLDVLELIKGVRIRDTQTRMTHEIASGSKRIVGDNLSLSGVTTEDCFQTVNAVAVAGCNMFHQTVIQLLPFGGFIHVAAILDILYPLPHSFSNSKSVPLIFLMLFLPSSPHN
ncbi:hypothetical protein Lal_00000552 [Lupinus albus]|nr:hypothetical protein Lal_00000552 [Lupinus albus]